MDYLLNYLIQSGLGTSNPWQVLWWIFTHGGFIFVVWVILKGLSDIWLDWRQNIYYSKVKWTYLAIDVPKNNEQSPKAVEQIFNQIWGSISGSNFQEKWWQGKFQLNFSLELVSIEGYIQYIIRTPTIFRDLIEASVYAQYPEAQITEIEDYTKDFTPDNFRNKDYTLWGAQFGLAKDEAYPIKTYPLFEHSIAQKIIDPMAAILEIFSRLGKGEQAWMQIVIKPVGDDWKKRADNEVKKLLGKEIERQRSSVDKVLEASSGAASKLGDVVFGPAGEAVEEKTQDYWKMLAMSPGERGVVEALERKADKTGFKAKIRYVYLGKKGSFSKPRGASGFVGALRQFALLNCNYFKAVKGTATKSDFIINKEQERRVYKIQRKILANYKSRSQWGGKKDFGDILNVEEIASIYHFPSIDVVAPTLKAAEVKKVEAPFALPTEEEVTVEEKKVAGIQKDMAPPDNLPI